MTEPTEHKRTLSNMLASWLVPQRFLAEQLRKPSGLFGRWVMARGLNDGNAELIGATLDALALRNDARFLDVGFGGGLALRRAAERTRGTLWGIDFSPDMVAQGQRSLAQLVASGRLNLITADVAALPLRDASIDAVCTTNTIYFWPDLPAALRELQRVVTPMGQVAFGYSGRAKMMRFNNITQHGFRMYEPDELESALDATGWQSIRSTALTGKVTQGDYVTVACKS